MNSLNYFYQAIKNGTTPQQVFNNHNGSNGIKCVGQCIYLSPELQNLVNTLEIDTAKWDEQLDGTGVGGEITRYVVVTKDDYMLIAACIKDNRGNILIDLETLQAAQRLILEEHLEDTKLGKILDEINDSYDYVVFGANMPDGTTSYFSWKSESDFFVKDTVASMVEYACEVCEDMIEGDGENVPSKEREWLGYLNQIKEQYVA